MIIPLGFFRNVLQELDLRLKGKTLVIEALHTPREGWFEQYDAKKDEAVWGIYPSMRILRIGNGKAR
ncbi:hypothetical protein JCM14076_09080 [Methylosoma difficile]